MPSTITRMLLAGVAASAVAVGFVPAAGAAGTDTIHGSCFFDTDQNATLTGDANVGVIGDRSVTQDASGLPTDATVTCQIRVNGVVAPGTTFSYSGFGVQDGVDRLSYIAAPGDPVVLCERVVFADGTDTGWNCDFDPCSCPPPPCDLCSVPILDIVNQYVAEYLDPQLCPVLAANAGTYGLVTIKPDGDVYVADPGGLGINQVYDCPPYVDF